nr:PREDICTED: uncharacterized protein LOC109038428 [Bemisia tabaci]
MHKSETVCCIFIEAVPVGYHQKMIVVEETQPNEPNRPNHPNWPKQPNRMNCLTNNFKKLWALIVFIICVIGFVYAYNEHANLWRAYNNLKNTCKTQALMSPGRRKRPGWIFPP